MRNKFCVHRFAKLQTFEHGVLRLTAISGKGLVVRLAGGSSYLAVGAKSLKLDQVSSRQCRFVDELFCQLKIAIVVHTCLSNDQRFFVHGSTFP